MSADPNDLRSDLPHGDDQRSAERELSQLQLELTRVRSEASAARLEARAAQIELRIRQLTGKEEPQARVLPFESWDEIRRLQPSESTRQETTDRKGPPQEPAIDAAADAPTLRIDSAHRQTPSAPRGLENRKDKGQRTDDSDRKLKKPRTVTPLVLRTETSPAKSAPKKTKPADAALAATALAVDTDQEEPDERRRKSAALLVSAVGHLLLFLVLGLVSFTIRDPKDQVALSASSSESAEETLLESVSVESVEPETEPSASEDEPREYELSPLGTIAAPKITSPSSGDAMLADLSSLMESSGGGADSLMEMSSTKGQKIQFCGVEGGGNHFVYLVDSSGSMGDAFQSARDELLRSIDMLKPNQRFYVVFFDQEPDYMRLFDPDKDEPRSVEATMENKRRLRQWASRISMDRGRAPYDPLRFALTLRADAIFLLSDGEFPQGIEDLLKEENVVSNLFGDETRISNVHTIGYYSQEGETRMRRIAAQHGGQYRYVPDPSKRSAK